MRSRTSCVAILTIAAVLGLAAASARATAPGVNGKLAFRRYLSSDRTWGALFTVDPDGSAIRRLTHPPKGVVDIEPDWSPNGKEVAFQRVESNGCGSGCETDEIEVVASDGSRLRRVAYDPPRSGCQANGVTAGGVCRGVPAWSPDGKLIAFECVRLRPPADNPYLGRICVMNADGSNIRRLPRAPAKGLGDSAPAWSPDGREIAFQRVGSNRDAIFVMRADGSRPRRLTQWALRAAQPDWSPDGKRILFYSNWDGVAAVSANLYTIGSTGRALTQLTHARGGGVQYLSATFSPDGKWITFGRTPGTGKEHNADVFVMRADGTQVRNVTRSAVWDSGTDWGPRG